jgi:hypothetical protein
MARGGAREGAGRKPKEQSTAMERILLRVPEEMKNEILSLGLGDNTAEKARYILAKGLEKIKNENQGN